MAKGVAGAIAAGVAGLLGLLAAPGARAQAWLEPPVEARPARLGAARDGGGDSGSGGWAVHLRAGSFAYPLWLSRFLAEKPGETLWYRSHGGGLRLVEHGGPVTEFCLTCLSAVPSGERVVGRTGDGRVIVQYDYVVVGNGKSGSWRFDYGTDHWALDFTAMMGDFGPVGVGLQVGAVRFRGLDMGSPFDVNEKTRALLTEHQASEIGSLFGSTYVPVMNVLRFGVALPGLGALQVQYDVPPAYLIGAPLIGLGVFDDDGILAALYTFGTPAWHVGKSFHLSASSELRIEVGIPARWVFVPWHVRGASVLVELGFGAG